MTKQKIVKIRNFFIEQKFRFDQGIQFLAILNFVLLIIATSDKLKNVFPFRINQLLLLLVPLMFICVWLFGFILDKFIKFPQASELSRVKRSPTYQETQEKLDKIINLLQK